MRRKRHLWHPRRIHNQKKSELPLRTPAWATMVRWSHRAAATLNIRSIFMAILYLAG
jgi:hypothetical protein